MVRITADLVRESPQFLNPLRAREIDLRGNKIPIVENLGATLDQFDAMDLSDNDITRLDGFPMLKRLKTLFVNNNRVNKVAGNLHQFLPNLEELILTNNNIQEFADIDAYVPDVSFSPVRLPSQTSLHGPGVRVWPVVCAAPFLIPTNKQHPQVRRH